MRRESEKGDFPDSFEKNNCASLFFYWSKPFSELPPLSPWHRVETLGNRYCEYGSTTGIVRSCSVTYLKALWLSQLDSITLSKTSAERSTTPQDPAEQTEWWQRFKKSSPCVCRLRLRLNQSYQLIYQSIDFFFCIVGTCSLTCNFSCRISWQFN